MIDISAITLQKSLDKVAQPYTELPVKTQILVCVGATTTKKLVFPRYESRTDTKAGQPCLMFL